MSALSKKYATNKQREANGVRHVVGMTDDGREIAFIVRRASRSNPAYQAVVDRIMEPHRAALRADALPDGVFDKLNKQAFCEGGIAGWENVPLADVTGNAQDVGDADFTIENVKAVLDRLPDLYDELTLIASERAQFQDSERNANAGN